MLRTNTDLYVVHFLLIKLGAKNLHANRVYLNEYRWLTQVGAFGAIRYSAFEYQAIYSNPQTTNNLIYTQRYANNTLKNGYTPGFSMNMSRIFQNTYGLGVSLSGTGSSSRTTLTTHVDAGDAAESGSSNIINQFAIKYLFDFTLMLSIKLTPRSFLYVKTGASYTKVTSNERTHSITDADYKDELIQYDKKKWGFLFGLGLQYLLTNRISIFTEYDYYDYGKIMLPTLTNVIFNASTVGVNTMTQGIKPKFGSLRFGINVNIF